jgi:stage II sporulation protein D
MSMVRALVIVAALIGAGQAAAVTAEPPQQASGSQVRVLLGRTSGKVELPQPDRSYVATWGGRQTTLSGPLTISRVAGDGTWQVGAYRDPDQAAKVAGRLREVLGAAAEVVLAGSAPDLIKVRVAWRAPVPGGDPAAHLAGLGFTDAFMVGGGGAVHITSASAAPLVCPSEVELSPSRYREWPIAVDERRYLGTIRARISGNELLIINVVDLETYLRGVVPVEMGPSTFPELEALKAQAVAARTYAIAHLGDHQDEGHDLCASPACQAYHGTGVHHPLTDRAVRETAGLIATYHGAPIDAMYTSTCGGHTDAAAVIFADRAQPYLQGVACAWERQLLLLGSATADGPWQDAGIVAEELALEVLTLKRDQAGPGRVIEAVARRCHGRLAGLGEGADAGLYARALLTAAGLDQAGSVIRSDAPLPLLLGLSDLVGVVLAPPPAAWDRGWHLRAALAVLEIQGPVRRDRGELVPRPEGAGIYPGRADRSEPLPSPLPLYESWQGSLRRLARAQVLPGTLLERVQAGNQVLALVVIRSSGDGEADRRSAWRSWTREQTWSELSRRLGITDLEQLRVTARSPAGRVIGLEAVGRSGHSKQWQGFAVRRALDLPECLFTFHRLRRSDGVEVVRFIGRGWGHGIGLCQNGAYGLARAGKTFIDILAIYYPGTEITRVSPK